MFERHLNLEKLHQEICIFITGGTFDKRYDTRPWTTGLSFGTPPHTFVLDILAKARVEPSYPVIPALNEPKDSTEITKGERKHIADLCDECPKKRIIVVHGTDTILEYNDRDEEGRKLEPSLPGTASVVAARNLRKTIVFIGAAQPASMKNTDADFNLGVALGAALFAEHGVYVAMNGHVFAWDACRKDDRGFFVAKNDAEIGEESEQKP